MKIRLHPKQAEVYNDPHRFRVVAAGRRLGKCASEGTPILMFDGSYKPIEAIQPGDVVMTCNEQTLKLEPKPVVKVADNGVRETLTIETNRGQKICVTPNHPILANREWINAGNLKIRDLVAVPRQTVFGNDIFDEAYLDILAIWLADGDCNGYTKNDPAIVQIANEAAEKIGVEFVNDNGDGLRWRWRGTERGNNPLIRFFKGLEIRDVGSKRKFVPDFVFSLEKRLVARFLNLFISCDGSVILAKDGSHGIEIGLANERLLRQITSLLLKFGVYGTWTYKKHKEKSSVTGEHFESWRLTISEAESLRRFAEEIGLVSEHKAKRLETIVQNGQETRGTRNSYLPISHNEFVEHLCYEPIPVTYQAGRCAHIVPADIPRPLREGLNSWRKQTPSRVSEYRFRNLLEYSDGCLDSVLTGDFAWVEVKSIKPAGLVQTYDLQIEDNHNFIAGDIVTHNSFLATAELIRAASKPKSINWYVAPTYNMCRTIIWRQLQDLIPKQWVQKVHDTRLEITLVNGSQISLKGADNFDNLRGVGLDFLVIDEVQDVDKEAWTAVLRPTLAVSQGRALFIGTSKSYNFLWELYVMEQKNPQEWKSWKFKTVESPFISASEIEAARNDMDEKLYKQEFEADFVNMSGRVAHAFDRNLHVRKCEFNPNLPIWVGLDFNINPMSCSLAQHQPNGELWIFDEITRFDSSVMDMCDQLDSRLWRWIDKVVIYPDPAGNQRQHGRGESSIQILQERGFKHIKFRPRAPSLTDRINAVNRMLMSAKGEPRLFIDPGCARIIQAFEQTVYKEGTNEIDKRQGVDHHFDAATYMLEYEFPVRKIITTGISL